VTDVSRASLELQALSMRVESLAARVDFNDRRVGTLEGSAHRARPQGRSPEPSVATPIAAPPIAATPVVAIPVAEPNGTPADTTVSSGDAQTPEAARRRRRRRRGRRSGSGPGEYAAPRGTASLASPQREAPQASDAPSIVDGTHDSSGDATSVTGSSGPVHTDLRESAEAPPPAPVEPRVVSVSPPDADHRTD
jgi:hypothetical protein